MSVLKKISELANQIDDIEIIYSDLSWTVINSSSQKKIFWSMDSEKILEFLKTLNKNKTEE
jgi:hypothetical protein